MRLEEILKAEITKQSITRCDSYAAPADFCGVFTKQTDRLYMLAFLLTADHAQAERCILVALEDCLVGPPVFKDWAVSYSVRKVVKSAIQIASSLKPENLSKNRRTLLKSEVHTVGHSLVAAIILLPSFERLVYVLSVLERYSDRECSILLDAGIAKIIAARTQALQHVATALTSVDSLQPKRRNCEQLKHSRVNNAMFDDWALSTQKDD